MLIKELNSMPKNVFTRLFAGADRHVPRRKMSALWDIHRAERPQLCRGANADTHMLRETHQRRAEGGKLDRNQHTWDDFSQDEPMLKKPEQWLPRGKEEIA